MITYGKCEVVTTSRAKDDTNEERTGSLLTVGDECFSLFVRDVKIVLTEENESILGNFSALSGSCLVDKDFTEATEGEPAQVKTQEAFIEFVAKEETGDSSIIINIKTLHHVIEEYWVISEVTMKKNDKTILLDLDRSTHTAPSNYSLSCMNLELHKSIKQKKEAGFVDDFVKISLKDVQIQPFKGPIFMDSFNCATWFTIGTFCGLIVLILFTTILAIGILYIMNIKSNDRFEDPKGKPLPLGNTDN